MWKLPQGDAYYAWALSAGTTTQLTPDEIHQMGQEQLRALQSQMDGILKGMGLTAGTVGERMVGLDKQKRFQFPEGDEGRAQIMAYLEGRIADIRKRLPRAFATLVPGRLEIKRMPPEVEPGAPGAYGGPGTIDGKVPGRRCTPNSSPMNWGSTKTIRSGDWDTCSRLRFVRVDLSSIRAFTPNAGRVRRPFSGSQPLTGQVSRK